MKIVDRPGYFGSNRPAIEASYNEKYGVGKWKEMWQVYGKIIPFEEAVTYYDQAYLVYLLSHRELIDFTNYYDECYDNDISNIDCGYNHDPASVPRHIQDISVRRAMRDLGSPFKETGTPASEQNPKRLLHIRGPETNGFILSPMMVKFFPEIMILPADIGGPLPYWCKLETSVEAFWQRNKVIVVD